MGLLVFIWLVVATVIIVIAVKDGLFSLPLTRNKLTTRISTTLTILCWPLFILYYLHDIIMRKNK